MPCDLWIVKPNINFNFHGNYYRDAVTLFFTRSNFVNWNISKLRATDTPVIDTPDPGYCKR